mgnify:FL=1
MYHLDIKQCIDCPSNTPIFNGTECVSCPTNQFYDPKYKSCRSCTGGQVTNA